MTAYMKRAHASIPGMDDLYHGYCSEHPRWEEERCAGYSVIENAVSEHNTKYHGGTHV